MTAIATYLFDRGLKHRTSQSAMMQAASLRIVGSMLPRFTFTRPSISGSLEEASASVDVLGQLLDPQLEDDGETEHLA